MVHKSPIVYTLSLKRIEDFFVAPEADPRAESEVYTLGESGLDALNGTLYSTKLLPGRKLHLEISLDRSAYHDGTQSEFALMIKNYAKYKEQSSTRGRQSDKIRAYRILPGSLFALGVCLALSGFFAASNNSIFPGFLDLLLSNTFTIMAWTVVGGPLDTLLLGGSDIRMERTALEMLRDATITITPV